MEKYCVLLVLLFFMQYTAVQAMDSGSLSDSDSLFDNLESSSKSSDPIRSEKELRRLAKKTSQLKGKTTHDKLSQSDLDSRPLDDRLMMTLLLKTLKPSRDQLVRLKKAGLSISDGMHRTRKNSINELLKEQALDEATGKKTDDLLEDLRKEKQKRRRSEQAKETLRKALKKNKKDRKSLGKEKEELKEELEKMKEEKEEEEKNAFKNKIKSLKRENRRKNRENKQLLEKIESLEKKLEATSLIAQTVQRTLVDTLSEGDKYTKWDFGKDALKFSAGMLASFFPSYFGGQTAGISSVSNSTVPQ